MGLFSSLHNPVNRPVNGTFQVLIPFFGGYIYTEIPRE